MKKPLAVVSVDMDNLKAVNDTYGHNSGDDAIVELAKCIDNGPMEGFWGILKRERYYKCTFSSRRSIVDMVEQYIEYYNNKRYQRSLGVLTPIEKYTKYLLAA